MTIKIEVTQEDIDNGFRASSLGCPIARAVNRVFKTNNAAVLDLVLSVNNRGWHMPEVATEFVHNFDAGKPVKPFVLELAE
jgi:hypothetical protein